MNTLLWVKVASAMSKTLPVNGFLINGYDSSKLYYLGGLASDSTSTKVITVYEFVDDNWMLIPNMEMPFHIHVYTHLVVSSDFNNTRCKADPAYWPYT